MEGFNKCGEPKDMRYTLALAALAAATVFSAPASAQFVSPDSSASVQARALLIQPATIQRDRDLSFGTIVATPTASGTVDINPDTGLRTISGANLTAGPSDVGTNGRFIGNGLPQQVVNLRVTFPSMLLNVQDNSQSVAFTGALDTASAGLARTIGLTGVFYVGVGGQIAVVANQMPGQYSGTVLLDADFQ